MFIYVHLTQEEGWHSVKKTIITHTNSFLKQQEQKGIISLSKRMIITSLLHQLNVENLIEGIIKKKRPN